MSQVPSDRGLTTSAETSADDTRPILIVPYMWIGDFVRGHSVVRVLKERWPNRPVDILSNPLTAPLTDYMPGVRKAVISELPRKKLALGQQRELAARLRREGYAQSMVMPRTWKGALAPYLAGIPLRTGHLGEFRFGLLNDVRYNERKLPRMIDQCAALALPADAVIPATWPEPQLVVPAADIAALRERRGLTSDRRVVAFAPGAVGPSKRWTSEGFGMVAAELTRQGFEVWILGGPGEKPLVAEINAHAGGVARDLTGTDLRDAIIALAAADAVLSNDSGLLHVAAAIGTPTVGVFGPTSPWLWAPLNPLAAVIETTTEVPCRPCHKPTCAMLHHRCMRDIGAAQVLAAMTAALAPKVALRTQ